MIAPASSCKKPNLLRTLSFVAMIFGAASVFSGGQVLFEPETTPLASGDVVPFVVWFNFLAGFFYMAAGVGLFYSTKWGAYLALAIAAATVLTFAAFGVHVFSGESFEARTVGAMLLRTIVWLVTASVAWKSLIKKTKAS